MNCSVLVNALLDPSTSKLSRKTCLEKSVSQPHYDIFSEDCAHLTEQELEDAVPDYPKLMDDSLLLKQYVHQYDVSELEEKENWDTLDDELLILPDCKDGGAPDGDIFSFSQDGDIVCTKQETKFSVSQKNESQNKESEIIHTEVCIEKYELSSYNASQEKCVEKGLHKVLTPEKCVFYSQITSTQNTEEITCHLLEELIAFVVQQIPMKGQILSLSPITDNIDEISLTKLTTQYDDCNYSELNCAVSEINREICDLSTSKSQKEASLAGVIHITCFQGNNRNVSNMSTDKSEDSVPAKTKNEVCLTQTNDHFSPSCTDNADKAQTIDEPVKHMRGTDITSPRGNLTNSSVNKVFTITPDRHTDTNISVIDGYFSRAPVEERHNDNCAKRCGVTSGYVTEINTQEENELQKTPVVTESVIRDVSGTLGDLNKDTICFPSELDSSVVLMDKELYPHIHSDMETNTAHCEHAKSKISTTVFTADENMHPSSEFQYERNPTQLHVSQENQANKTCLVRKREMNSYCHSCTKEKENKLYGSNVPEMLCSFSTDSFDSCTNDCISVQHSFTQLSVMNESEIGMQSVEAEGQNSKSIDSETKEIHTLTCGHEKVQCLETANKIHSSSTAKHEVTQESDEIVTNITANYPYNGNKTSGNDSDAATELFRKNVILGSAALTVSQESASPVSSNSTSFFSSPKMLDNSCGRSSVISFLYPSPVFPKSPSVPRASSVPSSTEEIVGKSKENSLHTLVNYSLSSSLCCTNDEDSDASYDYDGDLSDDHFVDGPCIARNINSSQDSLDEFIDTAVNKYSRVLQKCKKYTDVQTYQSSDSFLHAVRLYNGRITCKRSIQSELPGAFTPKRGKIQNHPNNVVHSTFSDTEETDENFEDEEIFSRNKPQTVPNISNCKQDTADSTEKVTETVVMGNNSSQTIPEDCKATFEHDKYDIPVQSANLCHQNQEVFGSHSQNISLKHNHNEERPNLTEFWDAVSGSVASVINKMPDLQNGQEILTKVIPADTEAVNIREINMKAIQLKQINFHHSNAQQAATAHLQSLQIQDQSSETKHSGVAVTNEPSVHDIPKRTAETRAYNWKSEMNVQVDSNEPFNNIPSTSVPKPTLRVGMSKRAKVAPLHGRK